MGMGYQWGQFQLWPERRQLLRDGQVVELGGRALDLLVCLAQAQGQLVPKTSLMQRVWPGSVVEDNNLSVQVSRLRKLLGPQAVVNVERQGYRLGEPVDAIHQPGTSQPLAVAVAGERRRGSAAPRNRRTSDSTVNTVAPLPERPSIAILPFDNLGGGEDTGFFCDCLCEDVTTELARFRELFVVARNSAVTYKGAVIDVRRVGVELGVRYVLEGSVRAARSGRGTTGAPGKLRITAQLIDAGSLQHVWAEKYDRNPADSFELLDELTQAIVAALAPQLEFSQTDYLRRVKPADMGAHALALRAWALVREPAAEIDPALGEQAARLAHGALALDAHCALAWRTLAGLAWIQVYGNTATSTPDTIAQGLEAASNAVDADPADHYAHNMKSRFLFATGQTDAGLAAIRLAHQINPNDASAMCWLGFFEAVAGDASRALPLGLQALRISPRDPHRYRFLNLLAGTCIATGDYAQGLGFAQEAVAQAPQIGSRYVALALLWVGLGDLAQAHMAFLQAQRLSPKLVAARLAGHWPGAGQNYLARVNQFFRIAAGLQPLESAGRQEAKELRPVIRR